MNTQQKTLLSIVLLVAVLGSGIAYYNHEANENEAVDTPSVTTSNDANNQINTQASTSTASSTSTILSFSTTYNVPDKNVNTIVVNITMKDGLIADISHTEVAKDDISKMMYDNFSKSLEKSKIIGKKISEVSLSKVGGASLTTKAFMQALASANAN